MSEKNSKQSNKKDDEWNSNPKIIMRLKESVNDKHEGT